MLADHARPSPSSELCGPSCGLRAEDVFPCSPVSSDLTPTPVLPPMLAALQLLQEGSLAGAVDFSAFFFLSDAVTVGGSLLPPNQQRCDDLSGLHATLRRLDLTGGLLEVSGGVWPALAGASTPLLPAAAQLRGEQLLAVAFQLLPSDGPTGQLVDPFERFSRSLRRVLLAAGGTPATCPSGTDSVLSWGGMSQQLTLSVGGLVLREVCVLGTLNGILLLGSKSAQRIYFLRSDRVCVLGA